MRFEYVPPMEDSETARSRKHVETMDRNMAQRDAKKAAKSRTKIDGQADFYDLDDDEGGENPF